LSATVGERFARWRSPTGPSLAKLSLTVLTILLCAGLLVPVYTDEIAWRFEKRSALDGVDRMLSDLCGPHTFARPPLFMEPVRWFSATANLWLDTPAFVRFEGVLCALGWVALVWHLAEVLEPQAERRGQLRALILSVVSLGMLPWLMVMSRPEQVLILVSTTCASLALAPLPPLRARRSAWLRSSAIVLLSAVMLSYHLKGVLYAAVPFAGILLSCPLLSGPLAMTVWTEEGTTNAFEEAQARGDHRQAA